MNVDEKLETLNVLFSLCNTDVKHAETIDLLLLLHHLHSYHAISDKQYHDLRKKYSSRLLGSNFWKMLFAFLIDIWDIASFEVFVSAVHASRCFELSKALEIRRGALIKEPTKLTLSHEQRLLTNLSSLRKALDDQRFKLGNRHHLQELILKIDGKIEGCKKRPRILQFLIDERTILYSFLAQQYLDISERNIVMKRMRDVMPRGVDRTVFDTMYHSLMSINCAIQGNITSSEKHEQKVMQILSTYSSRFLELVVHLGSLYKNDVAFQQRQSTDYLARAKREFERGIASMVSMSPEEGLVQRTMAMVEHARCLLGIDLDCSVCDIKDIEIQWIQRGRDIMRILEGEQLAKRRKMKFLLNKGRLYELCDTTKAASYVRQALVFAKHDTETHNMKKYLQYLQRQHRPQI